MRKDPKEMNKHVILEVFSGHVDTYGISRAMSILGWGSQRSVSVFVFASASQAVKGKFIIFTPMT